MVGCVSVLHRLDDRGRLFWHGSGIALALVQSAMVALWATANTEHRSNLRLVHSTRFDCGAIKPTLQRLRSNQRHCSDCGAINDITATAERSATMPMFPFGLPSATAFYLTLYLLTFALHHALMHYVLAGSIYVAIVSWLPSGGKRPRLELPLAATIRDWMPFFLSAAITAGVAPLLFVQIVYPKHFLHRQPVALLAVDDRRTAVDHRILSAVCLEDFTLGCLATAFAGNNCPDRSLQFCLRRLLLDCQSPARRPARRTWPEFYLTGSLPVTAVEVATRMLIWIGGSFATMATIAAWQFRLRLDSLAEEADSEAKHLAWCAIGGLVISAIAAGCYLAQLPAATRGMVIGGDVLPYAVLGVAGVCGQLAVWGQTLRGQSAFVCHAAGHHLLRDNHLGMRGGWP